MKEKKAKKKKWKLKPIEVAIPVVSLIIVLGVWYYSYNFIMNYFPNDEKNTDLWAKRGQLGDMFGAVNALFSGLAFAGIIYTIFLQQKELSETRKEFKQQNDTLWLQRFESTFFNLAATHNKSLESLIYTQNRNEVFQGRSLFRYINSILNKRLQNYQIEKEKQTKDIDEMRSIFKSVAVTFEPHILLYLEGLYSLLNYTATSDLIYKHERKQYFDYAFAQISLPERTLIYYYLCLFDPENPINRIGIHLHRIEKQFKIFSSKEIELFHSSHSKLMEYWKEYT